MRKIVDEISVVANAQEAGVTPALNPGKYGIVITNSDGESASLDASFIAN